MEINNLFQNPNTINLEISRNILIIIFSKKVRNKDREATNKELSFLNS